MGRVLISRIVLVACCAAPLLAGCGKKGPLEPPPLSPQARAPQPDPATLKDTQTRQLEQIDDPGLIQPPNIVYEQSAIAKLNSATKNPARPINAPPANKPNTFFLDPLVK